MVLLIIESYLKIQVWWDVVAALPLGLLGPLVIVRRKLVSGFLLSPLKEPTSVRLSRLYMAMAAIAFLSPFGWFCISAFYGVWNAAELGFATLVAFYLLKFTDYQVIAEPRLRITHIYSGVFVILAMLQFVLLTPLSLLLPSPSLDRVFAVLAASTILVHGFWIRSVCYEKQDWMLENHARLYFELPYRGAYNVVAGIALMAYLFLGLLGATKTLEAAVITVLYFIVLLLTARPYLAVVIQYGRNTALLRTGKGYKDMRRKIDKDSWEQEVVAKLLLARVLHGLVYSLIILSVVAVVYLGYLFLITWNYQYLLAASLCAIGIYPTQSYRMGSRATRLRELARVFSGATKNRDVRGLVMIVLAVYAVAATAFGTALFVLRPFGMEAAVFNIWGVGVTNVAFLAVLFVASLLVVPSLSMALYLSPDVPAKKLNKIIALLLVITFLLLLASVNLILYVVMTPVVASFANALALVFFCFFVIKARSYLRK
jgi:hypothetical protein